jgi:hypothetical protein
MVDGFSHRNVACTREAVYVSKKYVYVDKVGGLEINSFLPVSCNDPSEEPADISKPASVLDVLTNNFKEDFHAAMTFLCRKYPRISRKPSADRISWGLRF